MAPAPTPIKVPETMTPKEIGGYMAGLREHFKLSLQDVSEQLHIRVRYVQAIEQGQFEQMPGMVYARGYIHTYAEFLGLDADQVVTRCFAAEALPVAAPEPMPKRAVSAGPTKQVMTNWRGFGIAAVIAIGVWLLFVQVTGGDRQEATPVSTVEPVPEDLLDSVRNLFMATPQNIDCLSGELLLSCIYSDNTMQQIGALENASDLFLLGPIDVSKLPLAPLPAPATADATTAQ